MPHFPVCRRRSPPPPSSIAAVLLLLHLSLSIPQPSVGIRSFPTEITSADDFSFSEAPEYRNGAGCRRRDDTVHVAMTLDSEYLRGSIAAVHSVLRHATCPENVFFHFIAAEFDPASPRLLSQLVRNTFNSLSFKVYIFREDSVINLISSSIRVALENPLNYARNYLGDILDPGVDRVVYLDSDVVLVDDIKKLWNITLQKNRVIGAPEYCHANFTTYFTSAFWSDPVLSRTFGPKSDQKDLKKAKKREKDENTLWSNPALSQTFGSDQDLKKAKKHEKREKGENTLWSDQVGQMTTGSDQDIKKAKKREKRGPPCYFNTGVMVMDLRKWREGNYRGKIEKWMELQRKKRIYELGSLPPFLLVFAGEVEPIEHRWNQHGLGGDNVKGSCRSLHSGPVSLLHWSGKGKPWVRYDEKRPCPLDHLWKPYDLYRDRDHREEQSQPLDLMGGGGHGGNGGGGHGGNFLGYSNYLI